MERLQVGQEFLGVVGVQHHVTGALFAADRRRANFPMQVLGRDVGRLEVPNEDANRVHLAVLAGRREVARVTSSEAVLVQLPASQLVEVINIPLFAPMSRLQPHQRSTVGIRYLGRHWTSVM